ncbi:reverse transcriptase/maturase family protein [Desulfonatronovibrio hydrogenovorans]|uniref:reverse transcriptase/maturase family protein n=1 Tax=Desulfonatronovibrio hydrogenovorans TaxID=53245 RepID=UPI000558312A|nr:reverse transcriptase/maturase family protein [Desulfonatronovibrio hydrogenovorans]
MPRSVGSIYDEVADWDNLLLAWRKARAGKRYTDEVLRFSRRWEEGLLNIHNHLVWQTWEPQPLRTFCVYRPKLRLIEAPAFSDRIVHHALNNIVEPVFERRFVFDSYACRKDKGTHRAVSRIQRYLRAAHKLWGQAYVLQADISKYFPSISHSTLLTLVERGVRDRRALKLWEKIIGACRRAVGLPIGALTSQLSANIYLDKMDHHIKDDLGIRFYARYMDDWVVIGKDKSDLKGLLRYLEDWLWDNLSLGLNHKSRVYSAVQGVDFAGYRAWRTHVLPRKRNVRAARRRFKKMANLYSRGAVSLESLRSSVASFIGYAKHCQTKRTTESMLDDLRGAGVDLNIAV